MLYLMRCFYLLLFGSYNIVTLYSLQLHSSTAARQMFLSLQNKGIFKLKHIKLVTFKIWSAFLNSHYSLKFWWLMFSRFQCVHTLFWMPFIILIKYLDANQPFDLLIERGIKYIHDLKNTVFRSAWINILC